MVRQSVDLPDPEGPMTTTTSPRAILEVDVLGHVRFAEPFVDAGQADERLLPVGRPGPLDHLLAGLQVQPAGRRSRRRNGSVQGWEHRAEPFGTICTSRRREAAPYPSTRRGTETAGIAPAWMRTPTGARWNVHDSERLSGLLEQAGYTVPRRRRRGRRPSSAAGGKNADTVSTATSATSGRSWTRTPGMQIAVGGCWRRRTAARSSPRPDGRRRLRHPQHGLAAGPARACPGTTLDSRWRSWSPSRSSGRRSRSGTRPFPAGSRSAWAATTPARSHRPVAARHGEGPPAGRDPGRGAGAGRPGRTRGDPAGAERERLRRGVSRPRRLRRPAACDRPHRGLERVRFSDPHPASSSTTSSPRWPRHRWCATSCTCPLQSGSDDVLRRMRRGYRQERYLGIIDRVRRCPTRPSPPTSSSASGETEEASTDPGGRPARRASPAPSPSVLQAARDPAAEMDGQLPRTSSRSGTRG